MTDAKTTLQNYINSRQAYERSLINDISEHHRMIEEKQQRLDEVREEITNHQDAFEALKCLTS